MPAGPVIDRHAPGTFCWTVLATPDPAAAKTFYGELLGWTSEKSPANDFSRFLLNGRELGGLYHLRDGPPHWLLYVCVEDIDSVTSRAELTGAKVLDPPQDIAENGRMAVFEDPQGAVLALWQPKRHIGARIMNTVGTLCWSELATRDTDAARRFYMDLFRWKADVKPDYTEWIVGGAHIGGMLEIQPDWGEMPPNWMPYFQVVDCLQSADKAKKLGAKVEVGPMPIENVGKFAMICDPQGAHFYLIELDLVA